MKKYVTILDMMQGKTFVYSYSYQELLDKYVDSIEAFIISKGHDLSNCTFMCTDELQIVNLSEIKTEIDFDSEKDSHDGFYARKCDVTGRGMNEGFCFGDGIHYCIRKNDAIAYAIKMGYTSLEEAYEDEAYYYTSWEDLTEDEWYDKNGNKYNSDGLVK